jgi:hypothetical protein
MGVEGQLQLVRYVSEEKRIPVAGGRCVWEETLALGVSRDVREVDELWDQDRRIRKGNEG